MTSVGTAEYLLRVVLDFLDSAILASSVTFISKPIYKTQFSRHMSSFKVNRSEYIFFFEGPMIKGANASARDAVTRRSAARHSLAFRIKTWSKLILISNFQTNGWAIHYQTLV